MLPRFMPDIALIFDYLRYAAADAIIAAVSLFRAATVDIYTSPIRAHTSRNVALLRAIDAFRYAAISLRHTDTAGTLMIRC